MITRSFINAFLNKRNYLLIILLLALGSCSVFGQKYGPFTIKVKSEGGERVEDVLVRLSRFHSGAHGSGGFIYRETVILNSTDELATFPRGFVGYSEGKVVTMFVTILHPFYYQKGEHWVGFSKEKDKGAIFLGEQIIDTQRKLNALNDEYVSKARRSSGYDEEYIMNEMEQRKRTREKALFKVQNFATGDYVTDLLKMNRKDLVEKYLNLILDEHFRTKSDLQYTRKELIDVFYQTVGDL